MQRKIRRTSREGTLLLAVATWIGAWGAISTLTSVDRSASVPELMNWVWLLGFTVLLSQTVRDERVRWTILATLVLSLLVQVLYGFFIWWARGDASVFQFGTFYAPNLYAGYIVLIAPLIVAIALAQGKMSLFLMGAFGSAFVLSALALSGSRGGVVAGTLSLFSLIVVGAIRHGRKVLGRGFVIATLAGALVWAFAGPWMLRNSEQTTPVTPLGAKSASNPQSLQMRFDWASEALAISVARPLTGSGLGTFGLLFGAREPSKPWSRFVHNDYLQVLAEGGLMMAAGFIALILGSAAQSWRYLRRTAGDEWTLHLGVAGGLTGALLHLMIDHDWSSPAFACAFMALASLLTRSAYPLKKEGPD